MLALEDLLLAQDGMLTRDQALATLSGKALRHRLRPGGPWREVLPCVYAGFSGTLAPRQRCRAGLLYAGHGSVLAGATACRLYGLHNVPETGLVHVLAPSRNKRPGVAFVSVRRTRRRLPLIVRDGLPVCPVARAVVDTCRTLTDVGAVRALMAEAVQRRIVRLPALSSELAVPDMSGKRLALAVVAEVTVGVRSPAEAELRALLRTSTVLPEALWNHRLSDASGRFLAVPDAYFPAAGLVVECDSAAWHLSPEAWESTMQRHARLVAAGLQVLHISPRRRRDDSAAVLDEVERAFLVGRAHGPPAGIRCLPP
ncbi:MAG: hypothetical protein M3N21_04570 [Actinomycetota bacterium]|nr:hypothetical protein [Actinomycetota bacterium]